MNCANFEELLSDYLENTLSPAERLSAERHLAACMNCSALVADVGAILGWAKAFPVHVPPQWLPSKIVADTPHVVRETWLDTLAAMWRRILEPRAAMAILTAMVVFAWMGGQLGISVDA